MQERKERTVVLGRELSLEEFVAVARYGAPVEFSQVYRERVDRSRALLERWVKEKRAIYGVTTGFGQLCTTGIAPEDAEKLQKNILFSHAVSVGEPLPEECVRGILLMILQNLGQGYSGVRRCLLERFRQFLNLGLTPWAPGDGSVGYLAPEAHIAQVVAGYGKAYYHGRLFPAREALAICGLAPLPLSYKEGLALISGTTSVTALAALALYDMEKAAKTADAVAALTLEALGGIMDAFNPRVMQVRPHAEQRATAENIRRILSGSQRVRTAGGCKVQDALSLRCIPQLHGAVKKTLHDARRTVETEINSCCDNPIIWPQTGEECAISACNPDSSYVGIEMDSACIAAVSLAKMSERRNNRLIDGNLSGHPWFCANRPGLNSGLMIPQYTQAGLLNEMRGLATAATIDNTSTCGNQEDYVAMGYYASKKSVAVVNKLEYILAIELLSAYQSQQFVSPNLCHSDACRALVNTISKQIPWMEQDEPLYPYIQFLFNFIHSGDLLNTVEEVIGVLE